MAPLAPWVCARLWRTDNWCAELVHMRQELATDPRGAMAAERIFDLASATEQCDPDRGRALALYLEAWRAGHGAARAPAKALATALSSHMTLAELALSEGDLVVAGTAFLDAGFGHLAIEPLEKCVAARPPGASAATESLRLDGIGALIALARGARFDAEREIANALARAKEATGRAAAAAYLHAARVARLARLARLDDDRLASVLKVAAHACPDDDDIARMVETWLYETGNTERLLDHYRARLGRSTSPAQHAERARTAGTSLIARNLQPGLGLRLLRLGLEHAYAAKTGDLASQIATWELLVAHARSQRSTLDLVPLLAEALGVVVSKDVTVYLARLALEITWRDAADAQAAQPYAARLLDHVPDHPLATAFVRTVSPASERPAGPPAAPDATEPAVAAPPTTPAASWQSPANTTTRIPVIPQGQVKRVAMASSAAERTVTTRLALLEPPPPRSTPLERTPSPLAVAAPAVASAPRAARKVVPIDVLVELANGGFFSTLLRDVSTSGAFLVTKRTLELDTVLALEMQIPVRGTLCQSSFRASARIVRRTDTGYGLAFVDPAPELVAALTAAIA